MWLTSASPFLYSDFNLLYLASALSIVLFSASPTSLPVGISTSFGETDGVVLAGVAGYDDSSAFTNKFFKYIVLLLYNYTNKNLFFYVNKNL